jgi:GYF domain 2
MADQWYYGRGAEIHGPLSGWQVAELADAGTVLATDTVWEDGAEEGVLASTIAHLFPAAELVESPGAVTVTVAPMPPPMPPKKARATAGPGASIVGQDGTTVRFRMKCTTCGKEDNSSQTRAITRGTMRVGFFCSKCKKRRTAEINGFVS